MLILKSLTFSGIGRFVEEQAVDFTVLDPLTQIEGENRNTSGSSGAGKSTTLKVLDYLFGVSNVSNTVLQSRLTKTPMKVTGIFDFDGLPLKIERDRKLLIDINGTVTTGSSKLAEEELDRIIGMERELFRKTYHKRQNETGFFMAMGPSETHKFLTSCLGLEKEQAKVTALDARLEVLDKDDKTVRFALMSAQSALEATQSGIVSLGAPPILEVRPEALQELKSKHAEAAQVHALTKELHGREIAELEASRPQIVAIPFDRSQILSIEAEIGQIVSKIAELEKNEINRQSAVKASISELQIAIGNINNAEQTRQSEVKNRISAIQMEEAKLQGLELARQSQVKARLSSNQVESIRAANTAKDGARAKEEALLLAKELQKIRLSVCPTCEQGWVNDAAKAKEQNILSKIGEHKKAVVAGMEAEKALILLKDEVYRLELEIAPRPVPEAEILRAQLDSLRLEAKPRALPELDSVNQQIAQLRLESQSQAIQEALELKLKKDFRDKQLSECRKEEQDHQFKENAKQQLIVVNFAQKQTALRQIHESTIGYVRDAESQALANFEHAKHKLKSFEENQKRYYESYDKLKEQASKYQDQFNTKVDEQGIILEEIELAMESKKAIKSYLSCSFEDALESIGDTATAMIRGIPNMATATLQLDGLKENKDGKVKEEINAVLSMDGEIGIPVKSLSGGEESAVNLGIDLAVIKFIEERTGKGINVFLLDEGFTGLDTKCCEDAIEMLKNNSTGKKILLIDHNQIVTQLIENKILVIRDGLTSTVVQQ